MKPLSARSKTVASIGFGQMLAWGSSYYLAAILAPVMAHEFGLPSVAVFSMFSAALLVSAVLGPFAGRRVDRLGGRRVLQHSNVLFAIAHLVLASAQGGEHANGRRTWGQSMAIDPWGNVLAQQAVGEGVVVADVDLTLLRRVRTDLPALQHRVF